MTLTVGSLFSGIGGIDLGLERAGMKVIWQSEVDPYACQVLNKWWPDTPNLGDVTLIDWTTVERPDVICGGYPCQPFSLAGTRLGTGDHRHLWPYFAESLRVLRPRFAVLENVPGHLSLGFGRVLGDLASLGFDAEWDCIPAAAVGAPHLRYRLFVVATNTDSEPVRDEPDPQRGSVGASVASVDGEARPVAHPDGERQPEPGGDLPESGGRVGAPGVQGRSAGERALADADRSGFGERWGASAVREELVAAERGGEAVADPDSETGRAARAAGEAVQRPGEVDGTGRRGGVLAAAPGGVPPGPEGEDALPAHPDAKRRDRRPRYLGQGGWPQPSNGGWWESEPAVGRVATGIPRRVDRLRALGNAVVPQVAEHVGRLIVAEAE